MHKMSIFATTVTLAVLAAAPLQRADSNTWTQFRGAARDGIVHDFSAPEEWPAELRRGWSVDIGGGYSAPVVAGSRLYVHSRVDQAEVISALDYDTGDVLWSDRYPAPTTKTPEYAASEGEGPYATPLLHGGGLYTVGVNGIVSAYDVQTGANFWRRDLGDRIVETQRFCGVASSPLLVGDLIVVQVGDDDSSEVLALADDDGGTVWTWEGPATGNASPNLVALDGVPQVVTMTDLAVVGLDARSGELLWEHPFEGVAGSCSTNIPTPAVHGNTLIVSGARPGTMAVDVTRVDDRWHPRLAWHNEDIKPVWTNLVADGEELFGISQRRSGQLYALDVETGEVTWITEGRSGENGSVVVAGDHVLFFMNEAELHIARKTHPGLELVATYTVADTTVWAYPLVRGNDFIVRAGDGLTRWSVQ